MKAQIKILMFATLSALMLQVNAQKETQIKKITYECNFDCPSCEEKVMKNIPYEKGVKNVTVDYENKLVNIEFKSTKNSEEGLQKALEKLGYITTIKGEALSFVVKGNCGMCKEKIEQAAMGVEGVSTASWNAELQKLSLTLNAGANVMLVHNAIAKVGYDTEKVKADDEVYKDLHHCCKYER